MVYFKKLANLFQQIQFQILLQFHTVFQRHIVNGNSQEYRFFLQLMLKVLFVQDAGIMSQIVELRRGDEN